MTRHLDDDEKNRTTITTLGGPQKITIFNEPGLYSLILRSRKPGAKDFKRWVTHEVIPSIRKTGGYRHDTKEMSDFEILVRSPLIAQKYIQQLNGQVAEMHYECSNPARLDAAQIHPDACPHDRKGGLHCPEPRGGLIRRGGTRRPGGVRWWNTKLDDLLLEALADTMIQTTKDVVRKFEEVERRLDETHLLLQGVFTG